MTLLCAARCGTNHREAAPGYRLCWACRGWLPRNLALLVDLAPDLEAALSRANIAGEERVGGSSGASIELNTAAAAVRWQIHHDMVGTVRLVIEERALTQWPVDDIGPMARWLSRHTDWLAAHPSAGERANEAQDWINQARAGINPNPPKRIEIGPCVRRDCEGVLIAVVRPQDSLLPSAIVCTWWHELDEERRAELLEDGAQAHIWRADQWHALGRQVRSAA